MPHVKRINTNPAAKARAGAFEKAWAKVWVKVKIRTRVKVKIKITVTVNRKNLMH